MTMSAQPVAVRVDDYTEVVEEDQLTPSPSDAVEDIRERYQWQKIQRPKPWKPDEVGDELIGYYGGTSLRDGRFGQYTVALIHVPLQGTWMVSGTQIIQMIDGAVVPHGHPIKITWKGMKKLGGDRQMKLFEVEIGIGEAVPEEALPETH